jgi:DNA-directed RNA polymerase subunit K/omega
MFRADKEPDKFDIVYAVTRRAECRLRGGRPGDVAEIEAALALAGPPLPGRWIARSRMALARSLWLEAKDRSRARTLAAEARQLLSKSPRGVEPELAEIDAWLARATE